MREVNGDLIKMALNGEFDVIVHGCNCFNTMGAGIAKQIAENFPAVLKEDQKTKYGDINKLGTINWVNIGLENNTLTVVNAYTQYYYGGTKPVDYDALKLCMRKINHIFKGKKIGLPKIGAGLGGGHWPYIREMIIKEELTDVDVVIVNYIK